MPVRLPPQESEIVEFKAQWTGRALEDLASFTNHRGGRLYVGVGDDGSVTGFSATEKELQGIANQVSDVLGIRPRVRVVKRPKPVVVIEVKPSPTPVPCRGRYLVRVGSVNREMTPDQIARRLMEKLGETWDGLATEIPADAIDREALEHFRTLAVKRLPGASRSTPRIVLQNLKLVREGKLTRAGALLFGADPHDVSVTAQVHIGRFKGASIEDDRMVGGSLWNQLDAAMAAFRTYLQKRVEVKSTAPTLEGLQNVETWEYPLDALREAVVNALIHRDYTVPANVQVRVREDSIEVWSPGGLPEGVSLADLRREHGSKLRNPLLAQAFFLAGLVEGWGTGTIRMIRDCRDHGLPEPEFSEHTGGFAVTFRKDALTPEHLKRLGLNERQVKAVLHVKEHGSITNRLYTELFDVSKATASRDLELLRERGLLVRSGRKGPGTRYLPKGSEKAQLAQDGLRKGSRGSPKQRRGR